ncbi:MAG TPA: hypothetical protein VGF72_03490 [Gaiellaceae bacterium]|jgi:hypothetical protein
MRVLLAILLAATMALTAGCGGGKKTTSSSNAAAPPASGGSGSQPNFASAKNCRDLAGLATKVASAVQSTSGDPVATLRAESNELQALADAAPSDIRGDFQTFATAFKGFLQALDKAGFKPGSTPTAAQVSALSKAAQALNTPKLRQAEAHLSAWAAKNCKGVHVGG